MTLEDPKPESPVNPIAFIVVLTSLAMLGIEVAFSLADRQIISSNSAVRWRLDAYNAFAFDPGTLERIFVRKDYALSAIWTFFTYPFINQGMAPALFASALILALGKFVSEFYGALQFACIFVLTAVVGAVAYALVFPKGLALLGAYPPVFGLIGAYTYVLWMRLGKAGSNQLLAFRLIGVLIAIQLIFTVVIVVMGQASNGWPTWVAEVGAFVAGFSVSVLLAPGGWTSFVARMRQRP
ncbi:rhomboid family intramembrane serine protease [Yoonia sediminilitoris]|uniref:Membrane associated rhomboid family serine protease n=1 Tax=Yoonia sediminilitoris TaxID=1286148 RepID=A0A2T6KK61_9RHOB|nr:rhomboid family intramembrane serine protease [Yoonia sediminilitoris]PUB16353.1 membrane associated rhomboid family serine protease [Yoonia sediminilitoris]RCW96702.1 membrane associated rhomboid family serine protease [Yoonia sediminilitoris]